MAALLDLRLILVHAASPPFVPGRPLESYERMQEQAAFERAGYMRTVLEPLEIPEPVRVERIVEFGMPDDVLRSLARRLGADFIVVGFRGQRAVGDALLGSTSMALARDAPSPVVLSAPRGREASVVLPGRAVACGVDGSEISVAAARKAGQLAEWLGVPLILVSVDSDDDDHDGSVAAAAVSDVVPAADVHTERSRGPVAEELLAVAERWGAGVVAVGSRGRGPLKSTLLGSVSRRLIQLADRPVMVVSPSAAATALE